MTLTENQVAKNRPVKNRPVKTGRQKPAACHQNGRYNQHNG